MLDIYRGVTALSQPNFSGSRIPLSSNFISHEWEAIAHPQADREIVQYLTMNFPLALKAPFLRPLLAIMHKPSVIPEMWRHVSTKRGSLVWFFPITPLALWCQANPLLTHPKRNSTDKWGHNGFQLALDPSHQHQQWHP